MLSFLSKSDSSRDVFVTGLGAVSPLGPDVASAWQALSRGQSAATSLRGSQIDHWNRLRQIPGLRLYGAPAAPSSRPVLPPPMHKNRSAYSELAVRSWLPEPMIAMALRALTEAIDSSGLSRDQLESRAVSVVFGSSKGGLRTAERLLQESSSSNGFASSLPGESGGLGGTHGQTAAVSTAVRTLATKEQLNGLWQHAFTSDSATQAIGSVLGIHNTMSCPIAACATGLIALLQGALQIASGACEVCVVGSSDAALRASVLSSFHRLRVTSRHGDPATACRPFDETRDGFVIGEGAGVMILESREHLARRKGKAVARVLGGGWLSDPTGMTQVDESGAVVKEVIQRTISTLGVVPGLIGVHGTGTESNDLAESRGIADTDSRSALCFGMKGALGHLLGAAGSVETAISLHGLSRHQHAGTTNLNRQDARCPITIAKQPGKLPAGTVFGKLSLGFGGHTAFGVFAPCQ